MARGKKKRPTAEEKHPMELTDDEALEHLYSKEVRDKLKETAQKADRNRKKSPHK
jgi:hypothetical protein